MAICSSVYTCRERGHRGRGGVCIRAALRTCWESSAAAALAGLHRLASRPVLSAAAHSACSNQPPALRGRCFFCSPAAGPHQSRACGPCSSAARRPGAGHFVQPRRRRASTHLWCECAVGARVRSPEQVPRGIVGRIVVHGIQKVTCILSRKGRVVQVPAGQGNKFTHPEHFEKCLLWQRRRAAWHEGSPAEASAGASRYWYGDLGKAPAGQ